MFSLKMRTFLSRFLIVFTLATWASAIQAQAPSFPNGVFFIFRGTFEYSGGRIGGPNGTYIPYDSTNSSLYEEDQYFKGVPSYSDGHLQYHETDSSSESSLTFTLDVTYDSISKTILSFDYSRSTVFNFDVMSEGVSLSLRNLRYDSGSIYFDDSNLANYLVSATYGISSQYADGNDNIALKSIDTLDFGGHILVKEGSSVVSANREVSSNKISISLDNRTLRINPIQEPLNVLIYDLIGRQIESFMVSYGQTSFKLNDLLPGCYFIQAGGTCIKAVLF